MIRFYQALSSATVALGFILWYMIFPSYRPPLTVAAILIHEMGHILTAVAAKSPIRSFSLRPGEARLALSAPPPSYAKEALISIAGPAANFLSAAFAYPHISETQYAEALRFFVTVSVALALLNLLPVSGFDGGRIWHCLLSALVGPRWADMLCDILCFLSLFGLWCLSVYVLLHVGTSLSLFLFSTTLFLRIFTHRV